MRERIQRRDIAARLDDVDANLVVGRRSGHDRRNDVELILQELHPAPRGHRIVRTEHDRAQDLANVRIVEDRFDAVGAEQAIACQEDVLARSESILADLGLDFVEDPMLVRGLDYYTRTVFELESDDLGAQSALAAGGRYDGLAEVLGSKQLVPAVGFAAGFERLFLALEAQGWTPPESHGPAAFFVALGEEAERWVFAEADRLRAAGLRVGLDLKGRSLKAQMKEADRQNARYAVIVGKDELAAGAAQVKNMETGEQASVPFDALADALAGDERRTTAPTPTS